MSNRSVGTGFESDLCISLAGYGFWAHNLSQNAAGQPFDVLAARNGKSYPIDCKVCEKDMFKLERIETNQDSAMSLWEGCGNGDGWFALRLSDHRVFMFPHRELMEIWLTKSVLSKKHIETHGVPLAEWVGSLP